MAKTLKDFLYQASHIDAKLLRSVVRQVGNWEYFQHTALDVSNHGAAGGFVGFTYYSDTVAFTKRNKKAIIALAKRQSWDLIGSEALITFITGFSCLNGLSQEEVADGIYNPRSDDQTAVFNALAWYALEEVARAYSDWVYES